MKQLIYIIIAALLFFSCKKQMESSSKPQIISEPFLAKLKAYLKNNFSENDFASVDFDKSTISKVESYYFLQIGFLDKDEKSDFILVQDDDAGNPIQSRIVHLSRDNANGHFFNGKIVVESLRHEALILSRIVHGYVQSLHPKMFSSIAVNSEQPTQDIVNILPVYYDELPEVVVVGYLPTSGGGRSFADYMSFQSLLGVGSGSSSISGGLGSISGIYSPIGGASGGSGGSSSFLSLPINYESSAIKPGIDVSTFMKCFDNIPNAGAQFNITIFADLPVNNDPTKFFDWFTGATGHVFLQFTKSNGTQAITQYIGFTAQKPLQAIGGVNPGPGKVVDNSGHKYNASLKVPVTPSEFSAAISKLESIASSKYDIVNFNCVDFSLAIINAARGNFPLIINKYPIPNEPVPMSTPEALYNLLNSMHRPGGPEAANIYIGGVWHAPSGHGACN